MTEPTLAVKTDNGRMYEHPVTKDLYPSVTAIIGVIDKPALVGWAARETAKAAFEFRYALTSMEDEDAAVDLLKNARYRSMNKRANVGTTVHAIAEALAKDEPLPQFDEEHAPYADQFLQFVADFEVEFEVSEVTVFNDTHRYAGTGDAIARVGGIRTILDYKTSGSGIYPEVALQLAALRNGEAMWDAETGDLLPLPEIHGALAVWLRPDFFKVFAIDAGEAAFRAFVAARGLWPWVVAGESKGVVGVAQSPTRLARVLGRPKAVPA